MILQRSERIPLGKHPVYGVVVSRKTQKTFRLPVALIQDPSEVMLPGGFLFDRLLNLENATCP